jgi:putative endonuclease
VPHSSPSTAQIGKQAESLACEYLQRQGLHDIERNYRTRTGEVDLIMQDGRTLVFVEVRFRSNPNYGSGADSVTRRKQDKLINTALYYLQQHPHYAHWETRFDVVSISSPANHPEFEWIKNAFQAER